MKHSDPPRVSLRSFALWSGLGLLGLVLAVSIALVARDLADQPVGLANEPVSAGRALDPSGTGSGGTGAGQGANDRRGDDDRGQSDDGRPDGSSSDDSETRSGGSDDRHEDEDEGHDDDDD